MNVTHWGVFPSKNFIFIFDILIFKKVTNSITLKFKLFDLLQLYYQAGYMTRRNTLKINKNKFLTGFSCSWQIFPNLNILNTSR